MLIICIKSKINHAKIKTKKVCLFAVLIFIFNVFIFPLQMLHIAPKKKKGRGKQKEASFLSRHRPHTYTQYTQKDSAGSVYQCRQCPADWWKEAFINKSPP